MDANDFLVKIKANSKDWDDLGKLHNEYKKVLTKLNTKDRGSFSLNVLCLLCRNLDKVPSWTDVIDSKDLLTLSIDCIRETRGLNKAQQVKTLACIYHIHRHVVRKNVTIPPELILKISFMAFEADVKSLLKEYCTTYWNILADRLIYIEKLKGRSVHNLIPKLTEDILKTVELYDTVPLCMNVIVFLFKKLHGIFSNSHSDQLNVLYGEIFKKLSSKTDLNAFKKLTENELLDIYAKISDCLYVTAENASKMKFEASSLSIGVRTAISLLGHQSDMFHCLQTFYLNSFCDLFENKTTYVDSVLKNLAASCEITEKLGYKKTMVATYAYLNQFLRLYIEYTINNSDASNFSVGIQENCLLFMLKVLNMLKHSQQLLKCENCTVKTGLHDALRLSLLLKNYITHSLQYNIDITTLTDLYNKVISAQYNILNELKQLKCCNYKKFYVKLQTATHNTAILLNKHQLYKFSLNLFDIYIKNELNVDRNEIEFENLARAFYNKSICKLDFKKYESALYDAFLSLVFAGELTEKQMSLVMDIKAKSLKDDQADDESDQNNDLQLVTVVDACKIVVSKELYENIALHLGDVKFSCLLKHEFAMYSKLWPSIAPIAGVWQCLYSLLQGDHEKWMTVEDEDTLLWVLLEVISATPSAVRSIDNDMFKQIVRKTLDRIEDIPDPVPIDIRIAQTTLLFLKAEYDIAEATLKYGWKITETSNDPDQIQVSRTMEQEHIAVQSALQAVEIWSEVATRINTASNTSCLRSALQMADIFVHQMLYFDRIAHGLQLAHVCCDIARYIGHKEIFIRNAGVLAYHVDAAPIVQDTITLASEWWADILVKETSIETAVIFICDAAIYYNRCGSMGTAAKLVQLAQTRILQALEKYPNINLDLAVGSLLEAQTAVCKNSGPSAMSAVNGLQRHYLAVANNGVTWTARRLRACMLKSRSSTASVGSVRWHRRAALWRRARASCACALLVLGAGALARAHGATVDTHNMQQAQVTIDNRLKYMLGLSSEQPSSTNEPKLPVFVPKQDLEVMLETQQVKCVSPTRKYVTIPGFKMAEFLLHKHCDCYACDNIYCTIISFIIGGLEASVYFRANETEIAANYYQGVTTSFRYFDDKLKSILNKYHQADFQSYIINHVKKVFTNEFNNVKLEILMEAAYFELNNGNLEKADEYLVSVHEISQDGGSPDGYMCNELFNLMIASAKLRNVVNKHQCGLENEFDNLKLSPKPDVAKTPISKQKPPVMSSKKITVKDEEVPKKRKVIKLNLDDAGPDEKEQEKPKIKKPVFKIPVPVTSKHVPETITPRVTRKPVITVTDTDKTPNIKKETMSDFHTPLSTPEQFFTPLNTLKTYSKSSKTNLRKGIVKNLEEEFSTPLGKVEKEEGRREERERSLRRAVSPGKLSEYNSRPRRVRQPRLND